jgi:colanic acid/amylovoran biosynthesis glycosyltransferase
MKKLYFFTATFPFETRESFIETEIRYLSDAFGKVAIIPCAGKADIIREVPDNCEVLSPIIRNKWQHHFLGLFGLRTLKLFSKDFFRKKVFANWKRLKTFLVAYCTINALFQSRSLNIILKEIQPNDVMYFYWGVGSCQLTPFLSNIKAKKIVRFHGEWDLWEESAGEYASLREDVARSIDMAVFISKKGQTYFKKKYPDTSLKTMVSYLGTLDHGISKRSDDGIFRLLSCSSVIPIKRIHLIFEALNLMDDAVIKWTHIGDGIGFKELRQLIQTSKSNIQVKLAGNISNQDVFSFYRNNLVDAFINVSSTEGLPVTLMEAISFDVPIIGTDVGGTSEIVNAETGILLSSNPSGQEIAKALLEIQKRDLHPKSFWERKFNADRNYPEFIRAISNL